MLNNTIYKTGLFLAGGAVEDQTGTSNLDKLGGLGRLMPWTFGAFLIAAFSISGIPPFNGFVSKWMIYQGIIEMSPDGPLWVIWLAAAMFASGLTLASFMKLTHAIFLGVPDASVQTKEISKAGFSMAAPMAVLALLCVGFGVLAYRLPLPHLITPAVGEFDTSGLYSPRFATIAVVIGLVIGLVIYILGNLKNIREGEAFIGGELLPPEERVTGTSFYETVQSLPGLKTLYAWAEERRFDLYEQGSRLTHAVTEGFRKAHTGVLTFYLVWALAGLAILLVILMGRA